MKCLLHLGGVVMFFAIAKTISAQPQIRVTLANRSNCSVDITLENCLSQLYSLNLAPNAVSQIQLNTGDYPREATGDFPGGNFPDVKSLANSLAPFGCSSPDTQTSPNTCYSGVGDLYVWEVISPANDQYQATFSFY